MVRNCLGGKLRFATLSYVPLCYNYHLLTDNTSSSEPSIEKKEELLLQVYNDCLTQLKLFREKHIQLVLVYIINQSRKERVEEQE